MERCVLLTGVTGFLGRELLCQLLTDTPAEVVCLIRADSSAAATKRLQAIVAQLFGPEGWAAVRDRVTAVRGDVEQPDLGLGPRSRERLIRRCTHIIHGAASVRFDLQLSEARRINVLGTSAMLDLAASARSDGRLERFGYISTAFVAGAHPYVFTEDDLDVGQRFRNTYERSKFEAELVVRGYMRRVPVAVLRPSIVVGHSRSGATSAFNVIYWPLRVFADGVLRYAPAIADLPVDVVPVDFVASGVLQAVMNGDAGATYALAAGRGATEARVIGDLAAQVFATAPPRFMSTRLERVAVPLVGPAVLAVGPWRRFGRAIGQYLPYFQRGSRFDTTHADALLQPRGIRVPPVQRFLRPVLEFANATDFGRDRAAIAAHDRALARARARALTRRQRLRAGEAVRRPVPRRERRAGTPFAPLVLGVSATESSSRGSPV
jgi:thioester reductase-like protein